MGMTVESKQLKTNTRLFRQSEKTYRQTRRRYQYLCWKNRVILTYPYRSAVFELFAYSSLTDIPRDLVGLMSTMAS